MKKSKTWLVFISLVLVIIFRYFTTRPVYKDGDYIRITAAVLTEPIEYETSQYLKLSGLKVYLPLFPEISYGDKVIIEGVVNDNKLKSPKLISVRESKSFATQFRKNIISFYQRSFPEPYAGLTGGIVLGSKSGLTADFWQKVKIAGVAHVVVASGMNVTFVTSFLLNSLAVFLPRRKLIPFVILGIILYLSISGFDAPLVRAAIMGGLAFSAQETGRFVSAWRALVMSALVMLVLNPLWVSDIGFILSFVATGSILLFERKIREKLASVPKFLKEGLSTSLAAQIGVTPILFVTFGYFNILSPVINALVLWTIPYIMVFAALGGIMQSKLILYLSYPFLWWFSFVVTLFSS